MKVYLYILDTMSDWEIGYLTAEINTGRFFAKSTPKVELVKIGNGLEPITSMGGMKITPDKSIEEINFEDGDLLILPGADTWFKEENQKILEIVKEIINKDVTVAALCGATMGLAEKGFLDNRKHTSNDLEVLKMFCPNYKGAEFYLYEPAVTDNNLITASGMAPLEFTYHIFKRMNFMKPATLEAWFQLHKTKEPKYFYALMEAVKE